MTSMPHLSSMTWDFMDQLREVDLGGGGTAYYVYSGGQRVRKVIENGTLTKDRLYLGSNEIYRKKISGNLDLERETLHISDDTQRIAIVDAKTYDGGVTGSPTNEIRYQLGNHLQSASLELDNSANIISYEEYHPFGTSAYRLGSTSTEVSQKRYRYCGKERDEESGLYYYGARYSAAWLGRWTAVDPLASEYPNLNSYCYVACNPIVFLDPDGKEIIINMGSDRKNRRMQRRINTMIKSSEMFKTMYKLLDDHKGFTIEINGNIDLKRREVGGYDPNNNTIQLKRKDFATVTEELFHSFQANMIYGNALQDFKENKDYLESTEDSMAEKYYFMVQYHPGRNITSIEAEAKIFTIQVLLESGNTSQAEHFSNTSAGPIKAIINPYYQDKDMSKGFSLDIQDIWNDSQFRFLDWAKSNGLDAYTVGFLNRDLPKALNELSKKHVERMTNEAVIDDEIDKIINNKPKIGLGGRTYEF